MSDYGIFKIGGVTYPVDDSPFVESRTALDPTLTAALAFYKAMLETHLGAYFAAMVTATATENLSSSIVAEMVGYDPSPYLQSAQYKFPLLAMYRIEEADANHSVAWYATKSKFVLLYILPPLNAAQANRILSILKGVSSVIKDRTIQGYDPAYQNGAEIWANAGVNEIGVREVKYGAIPDLATNLNFPTVEISIDCEELEQPTPGLDTLEGVDTTLAISNGTPAEDVTITEIEWETA